MRTCTKAYALVAARHERVSVGCRSGSRPFPRNLITATPTATTKLGETQRRPRANSKFRKANAGRLLDNTSPIRQQ
jgi:hypothetical protein